MTKKYFYILLGVLGVILLVGLLWWYFGTHTPSLPSSGSFGSAQNKTGNGGVGAGENTNIPSNLGKTSAAESTATRGFLITPIGGAHAIQSGSYLLSSAGGGLYRIGSTSTYRITTSDGTTTANFSNGNYRITTNPDGTASVVPAPVIPNITETAQGDIAVSGVSWFAGNGSRAPGTVFNPTAIKQINSSNPSGGVLPKIGGNKNINGGATGIPLGGLLLGAAGAGALTCSGVLATVLGLGLGTGATSGTIAGTIAGTAAAASKAAPGIPSKDTGTHIDIDATNLILSKMAAVQGVNTGLHQADDSTVGFLGCIARTIARVAIQQITVSVVNWINSGFHGSPSFVTNPTQFFKNVADNAAGQFIRSSALSFLCSPFSLQVRIAIAQSYAQYAQQSCSLSRVVNNVRGFLNGNFAAGGWPGLISITSSPTNNPYGAYIYGQAGLRASVDLAIRTQQGDISLGRGFLSFKKDTNCTSPSTSPPANIGTKNLTATPQAGGGYIYTACDQQIVTPGSVIEQSLNKTLGGGYDQLGLAQSFDQIISALVSQLMVMALQQGLSGLSGQNGYGSDTTSPDQLQAQSAAQVLIASMQNATNMAQSYAQVQQSDIENIQNTQAQLNNLGNCWNGYASSTLSSTKLAIAAGNAQTAYAQVTSLNSRVDGYNNEITRANTAIALLEDLQSRTMSAASTAQTTALGQEFNSDVSSGQLITPSDTVAAQQDRSSLQVDLATINQQASAGLTQCYAFGN